MLIGAQSNNVLMPRAPSPNLFASHYADLCVCVGVGGGGGVCVCVCVYYITT
jgi:hypothetical protein